MKMKQGKKTFDPLKAYVQTRVYVNVNIIVLYRCKEDHFFAPGCHGAGPISVFYNRLMSPIKKGDFCTSEYFPRAIYCTALHMVGPYIHTCMFHFQEPRVKNKREIFLHESLRIFICYFVTHCNSFIHFIDKFKSIVINWGHKICFEVHSNPVLTNPDKSNSLLVILTWFLCSCHFCKAFSGASCLNLALSRPKVRVL